MADEVMFREFPGQAQRAAICQSKWEEEPETMQQNMKLIGVRQNAALPLREALFEGRQYLVAPVVALVEGVHNGSFYPAEEIAAFANTWNGVAVPVDHPRGSNGEPSEMNTPETLEARNVGRLFNMWFDAAQKRLRGEVWIDIEKAGRVDGRLIDHIRAGLPMEVSTGLFCEEEQTPGDWNGEHFTGIIRNIRPDHLALLPGGEGACNWADGCGIRANEEGKTMEKMEINILTTARRPTYEGTEAISWAAVDKSFGAYRDGYYAEKGNRPDDPPSRVQDAPAAMKNWIAAHTLLGEGTADNERDLIFFPVVNPKTHKLNEGALRAVLGGRASQADIPAAAKDSAQAMARTLLNSQFGTELAGHVGEGRIKSLFRSLMEAVGFKAAEMSFGNIENKLRNAVDAMDTRGWLHYVEEVFPDHFIYRARPMDPTGVGMNRGEGIICSRSYTLDAEENVILADDVIEVHEEHSYVPVAQQNAKKEETKMAEEKTFTTCLTANQCDHKDGACIGHKPEAPIKVPATLDEYICAAPVEMRPTLLRALARDGQVKGKLIDGIMANSRNRFTKEQLTAKDIGELEAIAELGKVEIDYSGASARANVGVPSGVRVLQYESAFASPAKN